MFSRSVVELLSHLFDLRVGVHLVVSEAGALLHHRRLSIDHALVGDATAPLLWRSAPPIVAKLVAVVDVQAAATCLVAQQVIVNALVAEGLETLALHPTADLLGTPLVLREVFSTYSQRSGSIREARREADAARDFAQ